MTPETRQLTASKLVVVGDIHAQVDKFWRILRAAGLLAHGHEPAAELVEGRTHLILLGDLVHAKTRPSYAALIGQRTFDEHHPPDVAKAEAAQEAFLREVRAFCERAQGNVTVLLGNHDYNALNAGEGVLQTDTLPHYEWRTPGRALPADLAAWLATWPSELTVNKLHFAHVGPKPEHNRYGAGFYLENRRDWILEPRGRTGRDALPLRRLRAHAGPGRRPFCFAGAGAAFRHERRRRRIRLPDDDRLGRGNRARAARPIF